MKKRQQILTMLLSVIVITILSFVFFEFRQNYLYTNRDRLIILCYQTNIGGSDGEQWAKELKTQFPDIPDFEVSVYDTKEAGNSSMTITTENGWAQIVTRLGAKQGDILFVDNEVFYNVLLQQDMLVPLTGHFVDPVTDKNGTVYGVDVSGKKVEGLLNHGTSQYVAQGQKLPIKTINNKIFKYNGLEYNPRVIAVIYKGSKRVDQAQNVLNVLFGEG